MHRKRCKYVLATLLLGGLLALSACSDSPEPEVASPDQIVDKTMPASVEAIAGNDEPDHYSMEDFYLIEKIDAHVHANTDAPAFIEQAKEDNFRLFSINVDYPDFPPVDEQKAAALSFFQGHPDSFQFAATFTMDNWSNPDWPSEIIAQIDESVEQGARAIKVWKNVGMSFRDEQDQLVMIDHSRFDPVFAHMNSIELPLIGHQGEPKNCWLPLEEMTVNNDRGYFAAHPEYHMYLHPEFPSYEDQMSARDRMLDKNPNLPFMGAHMASLEWSVDQLAAFLDRYPDAVTDLAARMGQVQYQSGEYGEQSREKVRQFFIKYQDRILYASDLTSLPGDIPEDFRASVHKKWLEDWRYLNTDEQFQVPEVNHTVVGLALPKAVIDKIYRLNAQRFFEI